mgnify:CR=1 FL=1
MKYLIFALFFITILTSCKKDYACYGSETVFYKWSTDNQFGNDIIDDSQQDFAIRESCMNCSKKDKDKMVGIIADYLVDAEIKYEVYYNKQYDKMYSKNIQDFVIFCEEK